MSATVELKGQPINQKQWQEFVAGFVPMDDAQTGRRTEYRHRLRGTVRIKYSQNGAPHVADLQIVNVSVGGINASHWLPISQDTQLDMQLMLDEVSLRVRGKVCHCTNAPGGHKIGIQFIF